MSADKPRPTHGAGDAGTPADPHQPPAQSASERPSPHPPLCTCHEPQAEYPDDWLNMHTHDGCRVFHRGAECALNADGELKQPKLPL